MNIALVEIVGEDGVESGNIARHAAHERRHQRRDTHTENSGRIKLRHQRRQRQVIIRSAARLRRKGITEAHLAQRHCRDARDNHDEWHDHLRESRDQRGPARRRHRVRRHGALHDQEIRAPVSERQHESQSRHHPKHFHAHRILGSVPEMPPGLRHDCGQPRREPGPAACLIDGQNGQRRKAQHDQEKLQHLIVDRAGEPAQKRIDQHNRRRKQDARRETPPEHQLEQLPQRVHRNA